MKAPGTYLSATEAVAAIEAGTLTSEKLVRDCLDRIAERDPVVKAWVHLNKDLALKLAKAADAAKGGVLRGVPVGVKDIIDTYDMPTGHNSPIFEGKTPFGDAACVALCRVANAVILGKTVTTEFANRHPGPTTNPHNPGHTPGGSSSGSAAAVADFQVTLATGTQTGGSVIRPAAFCGVTGYKPTFGHFPIAGMKANTEWLDTIGAYARSVEDIALFRAALMAIPYRLIEKVEAPPLVAVCFTPHKDELENDNQLRLGAFAVGRLAPIYGKFNLAAELPVHFQVYFLGGFGGAAVHRESVNLCAQTGTTACTAFQSTDAFKPVGELGGGFRFYLGQSWSLRAEVRAYLFGSSYKTDNDLTVPSSGTPQSYVALIATASGGVSFLF